MLVIPTGNLMRVVKTLATGVFSRPRLNGGHITLSCRLWGWGCSRLHLPIVPAGTGSWKGAAVLTDCTRRMGCIWAVDVELTLLHLPPPPHPSSVCVLHITWKQMVPGWGGGGWKYSEHYNCGIVWTLWLKSNSSGHSHFPLNKTITK